MSYSTALKQFITTLRDNLNLNEYDTEFRKILPNIELAESVYQAYTDDNLRKNLTSTGFNRAKLFRPRNVASHLIKCLDEIILAQNQD